ncbi:PspC domain-containing protein [Winogradskyella sp. 3972H.M.0a.05]|uniref:PspC domain-containing protein n=1 Tax=Winogradskyella sp. 3972H.M.0a.05 TaxID=2950277 RepID=UPI003397730F
MNKTVNINLAGIFFHIDEDAYKKLQRYLEAIRRSFTDSQGRSEIIADIEARIAELFSERVENDKQVVSIKHVDDVISIMGQPEDYLVDDEIFEDEPQPKKKQASSSKSTKKLYRDTDNSYIGGVAGGLGHYLGIDAVWVRLLWILLALGSGGTFIFIYLVFWALVPEATTTSEKLTMTGDPVTISNIEKKIKDSIESVVDTAKNIDLQKHGDKLREEIDSVTDSITDSVKQIDFQKKGDSLKSNSKSFFGSLGDIIVFFLKILAKFIAIILIITGAATLISMIIGFFTVGILEAVHIPGFDFVEAANAANTPVWLVSMLTFFAVAIPFFFIFYIGLRILVNNLKSIGNVAKFTLLGLWLLSIIGLSVIGVRQITEHAFEASVTDKEQLNIVANDTVNLRMAGSNDYSRVYNTNSLYRSDGFDIAYDDNGNKVIYSTDLRLIVRSTKDAQASIVIEKNARGRDYSDAKERAENINYNYAFDGSDLVLDAFHVTDYNNKFNDQEIQVILYLPEGTILKADRNTYSFHRNSSYYNDILDNGMEEHYLKVISNDVICLDCDDTIKETTAPTNLKSEGVTIQTDSVTVETKAVGIKTSQNGVNVKVDDSTGVQISTGNNN